MNVDRDAGQRPPPGRNGYRYKSQFGLVVLCKDEDDQRVKFDRVSRMGWPVKVVTV